MKLHYQEYGSGQPLIILHGLFGSLDNWFAFAGDLGEHFRVFAVDQRNHGRSPHADALDYEVMAEDLKDFMRQQCLDSASIMGHSMGGKTAMQFAFTYPERIERLIVIDIAPGSGGGSDRDVVDALNALRALDLKDVSSRRQADEQLSRYLKDWALRQFLLKNLRRVEKDRYEWRINLEAIQRNYGKIAETVSGTPYDGPCLFIRGENSDFIRDEGWEEIRKYFPKAELVTIPGAGHWVHVEAPEALKSAILEFLWRFSG